MAAASGSVRAGSKAAWSAIGTADRKDYERAAGWENCLVGQTAPQWEIERVGRWAASWAGSSGGSWAVPTALQMAGKTAEPSVSCWAALSAASWVGYWAARTVWHWDAPSAAWMVRLADRSPRAERSDAEMGGAAGCQGRQVPTPSGPTRRWPSESRAPRVEMGGQSLEEAPQAHASTEGRPGR